jgi:hypothetical protein
MLQGCVSRVEVSGHGQRIRPGERAAHTDGVIGPAACAAARPQGDGEKQRCQRQPSESASARQGE